jgi:hypothetical protein
MALAARDPYWQARMHHEAMIHPERKVEIQDNCLRCHAPAYQHPLRGKALADPGNLTETGLEGVTCTVCHRVDADSLNAHSFTAGFETTRTNAIFGPHAQPFAMPMLHHTGFRPEQSMHMLSPELCGSCHTLVIRHGAGSFVEQAPYLEWRASGYPAKGTTCITCHMPLLGDARAEPVPQYIAHRPPGGWFPPTAPRTPFRLHSFPGANGQLLRTLGGNAVGTLLSGAASLEANGTVRNDVAILKVKVTNKTGHKLPTGYPGRRLWLHVLIRDREGASVFESGAWTEEGDLAVPPQPHLATVSSRGQAVVYEAALADGNGRPTTSLISARQFAKDNRLLPVGFRPGAERDFPSAILPIGTSTDPEFRPGSHVSRFEVKASGAPPPLSVRVELIFQSVSAAEIKRLRPAAIPELSAELLRFQQNAKPVVIATREFEISEPRQIRRAGPKRLQNATP